MEEAGGARCIGGLLGATACACGAPQGESVSVPWGEDVLQSVRFWAGAHQQPPACSEQSTAVSLGRATRRPLSLGA